MLLNKNKNEFFITLHIHIFRLIGIPFQTSVIEMHNSNMKNQDQLKVTT
jgi:hypothetical protein